MIKHAKKTWAASRLGALFLVLATAQAAVAEMPSTALKLLATENPPFVFKAPQSGATTGAAVDLVKAILDRAGVSYSLELLPWNRAYQRTLSDTDTCLFVANRLADREALFSWVGPLFEGGWALYRRPGSTLTVTAIKDLNGLAISGTFTPEQSEFVKNVYKAVPLQVEDDLAAARLLYKGRADLWLSGQLRHGAIERTLGEHPAEEVFVLARASLFLACNKSLDPVLQARLNAINAGLDAVRKESLMRYDFAAGSPGTKSAQ